MIRIDSWTGPGGSTPPVHQKKLLWL